jgi:amidohydrolase family protein
MRLKRGLEMHTKLLPWAFLFGTNLSLATPSVREDQVLIQGNLQGKQTLTQLTTDSAKVEYSYNDRGRGDNITAIWKLDAAGVPIEYSATGNDYMKVAVAEKFQLTAGKASWNNRTEHGEQAVSGAAFYVPLNAPPEMTGVLARALLKSPTHKLALLPVGQASIEAAGNVEVPNGSGKIALTQYRISGLGFTPVAIWLDGEGNTVAQVSSWFTVVPSAHADATTKLQAAQDASDGAWSAHIAHEFTHIPTGTLVIRNARLFDPRDLSVTPGMNVVIEGERIARVSSDSDFKLPPNVEIIDAHGRFLMPGLWDNHQHFGDVDGALDLIGGVTSARDMANDTDGFLKRVARFDDGSELGPRVLKSGIIDGTGELAGPTKMRVDTADEAIKDVDWYADHGYAQIKIYSSVKPELVPIIAEHAHARGLRVSGHVPAFMSARQFIEDGADEIQHLNFVELNFLFPAVQETRNMNRFTAVAEHASEFSPDKPEVHDFIVFLAKHHTVLDPTMNIFENIFSGDPSAVSPAFDKVAPRLPPQVRRGLPHIALEIPKGKEAAYHDAFPAMQRLLKALFDAGVTIIPGTDEPAGYTLHHELELYARAGIPASEVLRMATLTSAQVMGVDGNRGVIAAGKFADMVLVDGDPVANIADIEKIDTVIKGGKVYEPAKLEQALGIIPRKKN